MKTVSPMNDYMRLDAPEPEDHQPPDGDCCASACSPLDDVTREEILAMVFDPKMERASVGVIWSDCGESMGHSCQRNA